MKKPRQVWPLLKQMLGFYRFGPLPLLYFVAASTVALVAGSLDCFPVAWMRIHSEQKFWAEPLFLTCSVLWYFLMLISTPLPFMMLGGSVSLEFLFTRAIDRGIWLRTERLAVIIFAVSPLLLNLLFSPFGPVLAFEPVPTGTKAGAVQEQYLKAFPGSHVAPISEPGNGGQLIITHGAVTFAAWLAWCGMAALFLVATYFSVVFTAWQRAGWHHSKSEWRPWLGALMVYAPSFSMIPLAIIFSIFQINILEFSFLFFATHAVALTFGLIALVIASQILTERNIKKLEFEFY